MLIILASRYDKSASRLVELWHPLDVTVLTCEEISVSGWRHYLSNPKMSTAVLKGKKMRVEEIDGVLTRLPYVTDAELPHIVIHDRGYVASEMMAFLLSWLSSLKCPVLNRPTPLCLLGPSWRQEQWIYAAAKVGIPVQAAHRQSNASNIIIHNDTQSVTVIVIGNRCFGAVDDKMGEQSLCLAHAAGVDMLSVHFTGSAKRFLLIGADLLFPVYSDNISYAILDYFIGRHKKNIMQTEDIKADCPRQY